VIRPFGGGRSATIDWLIVGLGNPGREYERTRHNVGFVVAELLAVRWGLTKAKTRFQGRLAEGRAGVGGARVAILCPQTFMNDAGRSVGPARGSYRLPLDRVLVVHDEIDLPFGEVRTRLGGGLAGHNGLKSLKRELGGADFWRVRAGVGRPDSTDPEIVSAHVLGRFREPPEQVRELVEAAAAEVERLVLGGGADPASGGPSQGSDPASGGPSQGSDPASGGPSQGSDPASGGPSQGSDPAPGGPSQGSDPAPGGSRSGDESRR
jgi:PTH1 family peptidyl-tRNA hydrolase